MTPPLPIELWRAIFREATIIPTQIDVIHDALLLEGEALKKKLQALYVSANLTKLTIALVCTTWHDVAVEFLFEHVQPPAIDKLKSLMNILSSQSEHSRPRHRGYGWWTKELHIPFRPGTDGDKAITLIIDLLQLFPNLTVLAIQGWFAVNSLNQDRVARALHQWTPKLRYLKCHQWDDRRAITGSTFLQHVPSLRTLRTSWGHTIAGISPTRFEHQNLTSLSFGIDMSGDLPLHDHSTLPSLTSLFLGGVSLDRPGIIRFVEVHGAQLLTLALCANDAGLKYPGGLCVLERFLCVCPNLCQLLLGVRTGGRGIIGPLELSERQYPNVELLGIAAANGRLTSEDWETRYPLNRFPNLKRIRLVDLLGKRSLSTAVEASLNIHVVDFPTGIVFEDALGNFFD